MTDELFYWSATRLAAAICRREYSVREVVAAHLARIDAVNPALNAIVQLDADNALARADAADRALAHGENWGPLHGVPFTVKDWIETKGMICGAAFRAQRDYRPPEDAAVVARLRQAGGIFLGMTNAVSGNEVYGLTNNPYNLAYSPAGSSSGEAAIIAAGGSPFGLGSDSGGSIRQPAHNCGIAGLKPSFGRVPLTGHFPRINAMSDPRTVIGPMARFVEDLGLVLPVIAGSDWRDAGAVPMPLGDWRHVEVAGLRVAFYTRQPDADPAPSCVAAVQAAAAVLAGGGLVVEEALPPRLDEVYPVTRDYWRRPESESWEEWVPDGQVTLTSEEVERHLFTWDRFRRGMLRFMERYDVILTPAVELPAQPQGEPDGSIVYTLTYSLTGYPCVVVRCGSAETGMPVGVQVVARPWRDDVALAVAFVLEQELGGWRRPAM